MKARVFVFLALLVGGVAPPADSAPVRLVEQPPVMITNVAPAVILVDFGKVAFGNLTLIPPADASGRIIVRLGETLANGRISRHPPGSVRYAEVTDDFDGAETLHIAPAADKRNTKQPAAVLTPAEWGVVMPFRWVEIEGWPGKLKPEQIRRCAAFSSQWRDDAATFDCSDETLNRIYELCRYSIKATTFAGIYVDGDRERIAYEADAYFSQLGDYYANGEVQMARDTFDRLMTHPTWPSEWAPHMIFIAYADWMQTGDTNWLAPRYSALRTKLQLDRARPDGLLDSNESQRTRNDVVDWPPGERDGFVMTSVNTVVNAFHLRALGLMARLATALNRTAEAEDYSARERAARKAFQQELFDPARGLYRDGIGTDHCSLHANLFPLAFGLVPGERRARIVAWLSRRGMACSVYAAQYLLEGLFENGAAAAALDLMTAPTDRSWRHMVESGTTITWEAWDQRYKPNQDWNHAWGTAPVNLLPRFVLGVQPLTPGWKRVCIQPHPGSLKYAEGKIPTPLGPVTVHWENGSVFNLSVALPRQMAAQIQIPSGATCREILVNGKSVSVNRDTGRHAAGIGVIGHN